MGYLVGIAPCFSCGQLFQFHPNRVPSVVVDGIREPICGDCVLVANRLRTETGMPLIQPLPGAYEPADEADVDWDDHD